ncbi:thiamine-phosphate kinase [Bacillus pumilus]|uniref:Thiamine-monophosphate kinase n=1 Tax=Bacillus pumilus TaxID=1408 RepID=A0AAD0MKC5_BACPU|nr:thiamine-phosphate kinase [Bacillus pumilus]AVM22843.1 thiamine-phosphate kinase [Bacillus pumilus]TYS43293.1 thiamine-phosphate kinase [Bacillus pumilus]
MDEFDLIHRITPKETHQRSLIMGIGDDASVYQPQSHCEEVVCVDTMVEHVHFRFDFSSPFEIGFKALAVNVSDIAAMGGTPKYYLVSIAIPPHGDETIVTALYEGMKALADTYHMDLIGGDTVATRSDFVITVTVIGEVPEGTACYRHSAQSGDVVFVTGELGSSAAGLSLLMNEVAPTKAVDAAFFLERHKKPQPHIAAGHICSSFPRVTLNDVSDGLASELNEIAEASQVTIEIEANKLPIHPDLPMLRKDWLEWVLFGGEDFVLTGTIPEANWGRFEKKCRQENIQITRIGQVKGNQAASVLLTHNNQQTVLMKKGYNHFKK